MKIYGKNHKSTILGKRDVEKAQQKGRKGFLVNTRLEAYIITVSRSIYNYSFSLCYNHSQIGKYNVIFFCTTQHKKKRKIAFIRVKN